MAHRGDLAVEDHDTVAHQTHGIGRGDLALFDADTGGDTDFGHLEGVQDGRGTRGDLDLGGLEHADTGGVELLEALIDDVVATDLDALALGSGAGLTVGTDAKADDDGVRGVGQDDVGLVDGANGGGP